MLNPHLSIKAMIVLNQGMRGDSWVFHKTPGRMIGGGSGGGLHAAVKNGGGGGGRVVEVITEKMKWAYIKRRTVGGWVAEKIHLVNPRFVSFSEELINCN